MPGYVGPETIFNIRAAFSKDSWIGGTGGCAQQLSKTVSLFPCPTRAIEQAPLPIWLSDTHEESNFIHLYVDIKLPQCHLFKRPDIVMTILLVVGFFVVVVLVGGISFGLKCVS